MIGIDQIIYFLLNAVTIMIVVTVFEFSKALMSTLQGDKLPKNQGMLTLNPFKFFEPIGFILFLICGYGWGSPVETSSRYYKNKKRGILITYVTPIVICVVLAVAVNICAALLALIGNAGYISYAVLFLGIMAKNFAAIAVFNLLPVYPMAGSNIIRCFLSPNQAIAYSQYEKPIQIFIVFLLVLGLLPRVLDVIVNIIV